MLGPVLMGRDIRAAFSRVLSPVPTVLRGQQPLVPVVTVLRKLRQEGCCQFQASLTYRKALSQK